MRLDLYVKKNLALFISKDEPNRTDFLKLPRSFWQKEIDSGNIKFKNKIVKTSIKVSESEKFLINFDWEKIKKNWKLFYERKLVPVPIKVGVIRAVSGTLAINKPAGISVHPAFPLKRGVKREPSLVEGIVFKFPNIAAVSEKGEEERPGIVHRLDKNTSGVLLIAQSVKNKRFLKEQFKKRLIKKIYLALVEGDFPHNKFIISSLLGKKENNPVEIGVSELSVRTNTKDSFSLKRNFVKILNPKKSVTNGKKIASGTLEEINGFLMNTRYAARSQVFPKWKKSLRQSKFLNKKTIFSLLELHPLTGRTHQIRAHLSILGFPVAGDRTYGSHFKDLSFHCLHSYKISWLDMNGKKHSVISNRVILF